MTWHEGHDVRMMKEDPPTPGARFGPWCADCDETAFWGVVPTTEQLEQARQYVAEHPELRAACTTN